MTEAEWSACEDPQLMLSALGAAASPRKQRLLGLACCRRLSHLLHHDDLQRAQQVAEAWIEGASGPAQRKQARRAAHAAAIAASGATLEESLTLSDSAAWAVQRLLQRGPLDVSHLHFALGQAMSKDAGVRALLDGTPQATRLKALPEARKGEERGQSGLLRDIFGNPFRPPAFDPRWRTADVLALGRGVYEDWAFDRLPLLADALLDAGCDNEDVLAHCRNDGPHVRGCWVVDLALGNE